MATTQQQRSQSFLMGKFSVQSGSLVFILSTAVTLTWQCALGADMIHQLQLRCWGFNVGVSNTS